MHLEYFEVDEMTRPVELVENSRVTAEEAQIAYEWYWELKYTVLTTITIEIGVVAFTFLVYVTYHLISKLRGNEQNVSMNSYGIGLAALGFVNFSVSFTVNFAYILINQKYYKWTEKHLTLYRWIWWSS